MTTLKSVRLALHMGRNSVTWALVLRTDNGQAVFDRRLHSGLIPEVGRVEGTTDIPDVLREIAEEIERRHGIAPPPQAAREPRGAVGGVSDHRAGRVCASGCPLCGEHLDGMPSDD